MRIGGGTRFSAIRISLSLGVTGKGGDGPEGGTVGERET